MAGNLIYFIITTGITIAIGIISYFLKRTMDKIDKLESEVRESREAQYLLSEKYATKAEVAEIKATMQKLTDNIDYIKEQELRDSVNYLSESGYINMRSIRSKQSTTLADCDFYEIEAKVSADGIKIIACVKSDECIEV